MKRIFFFNGWGMDELAFPKTWKQKEKDYQVHIINYPYDIETLIQDYAQDEVYAIAWSFGVYYFSKLEESIQNKFKKKVAINGVPETLGPYGISPKMCLFTLENLNPESLEAFYKNMDFQGKTSKSFFEIQEELSFFYHHYQAPAKNVFDFAWIGEYDRIFSSKKMIRYYEKEKVPYQLIPLGHDPFSYFSSFIELLGE